MASGSKVKDAAGNVGTASNLSTSLVQRVAQGVRYAVSGVKPDGWFGPSQPIEPAAQEATGRVLDYPVGYNLLQRPRQETEAVVSFQDLRGLSEACNIMRLAIETRKDQIARLAWNIKLRDDETKKGNTKKRDPRIAACEAFFRAPDKEHDWATWLRLLVEDLLVIDAPTIIRRKDKGGKPYAFNVMDGALVKRVIDDDGLTPLPPNPAYQQILHGLAAVDYTTDQLLYMPRNKRSHRLYGYSPVEQVVMMVNIALRRSVAQLNYFTEGNIPEALISCPPEWRPQQIREMQEIFDGMLRGDLAGRSGAKFVPGGLDVQFTKDALLKDEFDEWLARIICFAFSIPPTAFVKQMNRASSQTQKESADEEGLAPLQQWVKTMMDRLLAEDFASPDLEFVWYDDTSADPLVLAQVNQIYVNTGIKTRNEVRGELGLDPIPNGDETTITTGTGVTRLSDALEPPEPVPAALQPHTGTGVPALPAPANDQDAEDTGKPVAPKAKGLKKADDASDASDFGQREKELAEILHAALQNQRDKLAAKVAGSDSLPDASASVNAEIISGSFGMDAVQAPVAAILSQSAEGAALEALEALPVDGSAEASIEAEAGGVGPHSIVAAQPDLTTSITDKGITSLVNEDAVQFAAERSAEMIGKKLVDGALVDNPHAKWAITETTRDGIRKLVEQAEQEGQSVEQLATAIRESALFSADRARRIAQWELGFSANNGNLIAWKRSGVVKGKKWLLGSEHEICDECDSNVKAGVIGLDDLFPSGHPCPPAHVACPCSVGPVVNVPGQK